MSSSNLKPVFVFMLIALFAITFLHNRFSNLDSVSTTQRPALIEAETAVSSTIQSTMDERTGIDKRPATAKTIISNSVLKSIYDVEQSIRELAIKTADDYISAKPRPEAILGWRPTFLNVESVVSGQFSSKLDASKRLPASSIEIEAFPNVKFIARKTRYLDYGWSGIWEGEIIEGGTGTVTVNIVTDEQARATALVQIVTEQQRISITYTGENQTYVVMDLNTEYHQQID